MASPQLQSKISAREAEIVRVARAQIDASGWNEFTMERLLSGLSLSRGTLYRHFSNREDVAVAIVCQSMVEQLGYVKKAAETAGCSRERYLRVVAAFRLYDRLKGSFARHCVQLFSEGVRERASADRVVSMMTHFEMLRQIPVGIIRDGLAEGSMEMARIRSPEWLSNAVWSAILGVEGLVAMRPPGLDHQVGSPLVFLLNLLNNLLDGYGWRPLSSERDYERLVWEACWKIFPRECRQADIPLPASVS